MSCLQYNNNNMAINPIKITIRHPRLQSTSKYWFVKRYFERYYKTKNQIIHFTFLQSVTHYSLVMHVLYFLYIFNKIYENKKYENLSTVILLKFYSFFNNSYYISYFANTYMYSKFVQCVKCSLKMHKYLLNVSLNSRRWYHFSSEHDKNYP